MTAVKICGINSAAAFDAAVRDGADWVGFVFFARSPRFLTAAQAASLSARHAGGPQRVGLFVSAPDADIAAVLAEVKLDILQLYDTPERVEAIASRFSLPVWRSVSVTDTLPKRAGAASALVVEPPAPLGASRPGGNAASFDWHLLRGWTPGFPWLLAGGLTPVNVQRAIAESGAQAVDVSSGVETAPGVKSADLIRRFIAACRVSDGLA